jgi:hypothetical protein
VIPITIVRRFSMKISIAMFLVTMAALMISALPSDAADRGSNSRNQGYEQEIQTTLDDLQSFAEEDNKVVVESDIVSVDDGGYTIDIELPPGFYNLWVTLDSRFGPEDITVEVFNESDELIGGVQGVVDDYVPIAEFVVDATQDIRAEITVAGLSGREEAFAGYLLTTFGGLDEESRNEYIQRELSGLMDAVEWDGGDIVAYETDLLTWDTPSMTFYFELPEGEYIINATAGYLIRGLGITVFGGDDNALAEDVLSGNFPTCVFEVDRKQDVSIVIGAYDFYVGYTEDNICWVLSSTQPYEGPVG